LTLLFRPPAASTLFPYTTLFRSVCRGCTSSVAMGARFPAARVRKREPQACGLRPAGVARGRARRALRRGGGADRRLRALLLVHGDRKSTRLNSSHVAISYAVFCL